MNYIEKTLVKKTHAESISTIPVNVINNVEKKLQANLSYKSFNTTVTDLGEYVIIKHTAHEQTYCSSGADVDNLQKAKQPDKPWYEYKSDTIRECLEDLEKTNDLNTIREIEEMGQAEADRIKENWRLNGLACSRAKRARDFKERVILNLSKIKDLSNVRFITFTFDPKENSIRYDRLHELANANLSDPKVISKCFTDFIKRMNRTRKYKYKYSYVIELTEDNICHIHAVFYNFNKDTLDKTIIENWGYGYVTIDKLYRIENNEKINIEKGNDESITHALVFYLGKQLSDYVIKALEERAEDTKGCRMTSHSRDTYSVNRNRLKHTDKEFIDTLKRTCLNSKDGYKYHALDYQEVYKSGLDIEYVKHQIASNNQEFIDLYSHETHVVTMKKSEWKSLCSAFGEYAFAPATDPANVKTRRQAELENTILDELCFRRVRSANKHFIAKNPTCKASKPIFDLALDPNFEPENYNPIFKKLIGENNYPTFGFTTPKQMHVHIPESNFSNSESKFDLETAIALV